MSSGRFLSASLLLLAAWAVMGALASSARAEVIERVVAVVNDQAIFLSDLRRRAVPFLDQIMQNTSELQRSAQLEQLYGQLLDQIIDEELIEQEATKLQVRVSSSDVDLAIENVRRQAGLEPDEFWEAIRMQGFTEAQYRADLRRQLLRFKILNQRVRGRVNITEDDVRRAYEERMKQETSELRFRAAHVFFPIPEGATATEVARIRERADLVAGNTSADKFQDAIAQHGGGDLGWLRQGDLPPALDDALSTMQRGQVSAPVRGPNGFHVLLLYEREVGRGGLPSYAEARDRIMQEMMEVAMQRQQKIFLEELRRDALIDRKM